MKVKRRKNKIGNEKSFFKLFEENSKKGISPVVATGLLLVVAVVGVMGFNTWFNTFQSGIFSGIEKQTNNFGSTKVETILGGNILYLKNSDPVNILSVKSNGNDCYVSGYYPEGLIKVPISNCLDTGKNEIVITTETGVYSSYFFNDETWTSPCPKNYILVPGNVDLKTKNFCVMKYEAKATTSSLINLNDSTNMYCGNGNDYGTNNCPTDGSVNITSKPEYKPLTQVTQVEARQLCENLGPGYHLITDAEWVTIARNAENNPNNWDSGIVGSGSMWRGHSDNHPSNSLSITNINNYYDGTGNSFPSIERRVLELSNGETIWDLSGNVWEWNNDTFNSNVESSLGQGSFGWYEWTQITGYDYLEPFDSTLDSTNGVGRVYADTDDAYPSGTVHGFLRGGCWNYGALAGAFALRLSDAPSYSNMYLGFRCSYSP